MKGRRQFWGDFQYISAKQYELSYCINNYRRKRNLSQVEFANVCNEFGKPYNVKFSHTEISKYERMTTAPRIKKYMVLCKVLNIYFDEEEAA